MINYPVTPATDYLPGTATDFEATEPEGPVTPFRLIEDALIAADIDLRPILLPVLADAFALDAGVVAFFRLAFGIEESEDAGIAGRYARAKREGDRIAERSLRAWFRPIIAERIASAITIADDLKVKIAGLPKESSDG